MSDASLLSQPVSCGQRVPPSLVLPGGDQAVFCRAMVSGSARTTRLALRCQVDLLTCPPNWSLIQPGASFEWHLVPCMCGGSKILGQCVRVVFLILVAAADRAQQ